MSVEFVVLGDVEARLDGLRLEIGHARQRCVLAVLLMEVNRAVPPDQLLERVWADRPPIRARNSLAGYVSRLRHLLAGAPGVMIATQPGGYLLSIDELAVDLYGFRQLVRQARASDDPLEAAALFDRALAMWRGEPFASLDTPWVNEMRAALEAERRAVLLDRNDVALRAGRHGELLAELTAALTAQPLDERLAGQVMVAQYRCGRQADALETYRQMRQRLVEELGVDPGPGLRQVHQHILNGDADDPLVLSPYLAGRAAGLVLHRPWPALPRRVTSFVGHHEQLRAASEALGACPLVTLAGAGGVGKTRLAYEVAWEVQQRFGEGVWICELAGLDSAVALPDTVAAALRLQRQQGLDICETIIEYLRARELLLVIDNCEHVLEAAAGLIDQIVTHCPTARVLATSREPLRIEGERIIVLPPLSVGEAVALFADRAKDGCSDFDLDRQPPEVAAQICRRVDCLPLGVELAAARMRVMSSSEVLQRLDHLHLLRGGVRGAPARQQSLTATIDWSYRLLTAPERALFVRISVFAGGFDLDAAHAVCGSEDASEDDTVELLAALVDKSMVVVRSGADPTRYDVLETLRAYGRERLGENGLTDQYATRHARYYTELAERAAAGLHGPDEQIWVQRMLPDYHNLRAAFERAMTQGDSELALRLVTSVPELIGLRIGYEPGEWAERVIAVTDPDHPLFTAAVGTAARAAANHRDLARARKLAALAAGRVPGPGTARVSYPADVLADVTLFEGDIQGARTYWESQVESARRDGDPVRLVWTVFMFAICNEVLGVSDAAVPVAQDAVRVADTTANPTTRSMAYFALGYLLKKSEPQRALALLDEAVQLASAVQNYWCYGIALMEGTSIRAVHADPVAAAQMFIEVLEHWDRVGDWFEQWIALRYISRLLLRLGADDDALYLTCAFVNTGKPSPLRPAQLHALIQRLGDNRYQTHNTAAYDHAAVVARVRAGLQCHTTPSTIPAQ